MTERERRDDPDYPPLQLASVSDHLESVSRDSHQLTRDFAIMKKLIKSLDSAQEASEQQL